MIYPIKCPKCGEKIEQEIIELKKGGFIYLEKCSKNNTHYKHYRDVEFFEIQSWN